MMQCIGQDRLPETVFGIARAGLVGLLDQSGHSPSWFAAGRYPHPEAFRWGDRFSWDLFLDSCPPFWNIFIPAPRLSRNLFLKPLQVPASEQL